MAKTDLSLDPIINVIHKGIRRGIQVTFENGCLGSCLILIYAAMDAMASLERPANVKSVRREDFIAWADKYIRFPCKEQLTGIDLYGARCALIHQYGIESDLSRGGDCRQIGYVDKMIPEVKFDPSTNKSLVIVSIKALKDAFFSGVDNFLLNAYAKGPGSEKVKLVEKRLRDLLHGVPYPKTEKDKIRMKEWGDQHSIP